MKRSIGVIISAIVGILGSLLCLAFGAILLVGIAALPADAALSTGQSVRLIALFEAIAAIGLAMIGIAFSIGLLMRQKWARIGFIVFAGLLDAGGLFGIFAGIVTALMGDRLTQGQQVPPSLMLTTAVVTIVISLIGIALGIGWLIYFTRSSVKVQFQGEGVQTPRRGPLSPKVIAWILIVGGVFSPLVLLFSYPIVLFGFVFRGAQAKIVLLLFGMTGLVSGIGILRWRPWAYLLAIGYYCFALMNQLVLILVPGAMTRMQEVMLETQPQLGMTTTMANTFMWAGSIFGCLAMIVPLALLISRRKRFFDACAQPAPLEVQST